MNEPTPAHVHPTLDDPVVRVLSEGVGGPVGTRAAPSSPWWTPVRVLMVIAAIFFALGMLQKTGCYADGFQSNETRYTQMCYSDLPYLYTGRGLSELDWPYTDDARVRDRFETMEYPVGISYFAYGAAWVTHWASGSPDLTARKAGDPGALFGTPEGQKEIKTFYAVQALAFAALIILTVWFLAGTNRRRPWDAAIFAASPMLMLTGMINWDVLALVFVGAALWAWSQGRPVLTGVMIGLGMATKLYPLFLLGGVVIICVRQRRWVDLGLTTLAGVVAWVVADAPAYVSSKEQWKVFWSFNSDRTADLGSIWIVLQQASDKTISASTINHWSYAFFIAWCIGVAVVGLAARSTPRLAQLGFLVVAGFLLVNKVYSPQYVLWLLPLAALARPRWRDQLIWQGTELLYFASVWWYLDNQLAPADGGDAVFYWVAVLVRMAGEIYLIAMVTRDILIPAHDVVERDPVRGEPSPPSVEDRPLVG